MLKRLAAGFIHLLGGSTAEDVEYIERQWQGKLERCQKMPCTPGAGGNGGTGHTPSWYGRAAEPLFIPSTAPQGQILIIKPDTGVDKPPTPERKGALRLTGRERREMAAEAVRWCEQQDIEENPENVIFYLDNEGHLIRHA